MAIIYSYPELLSLEDRDLLLISDLSSKKSPTNRVELGTIKTYINSSVDVGVTSIIAGTGVTIDQPTGDVTINASGIVTPWNTVPNGISYKVANVGIGTGTPDFILDVRGSETFIQNVLTVGDEPDPTEDPTPNGSRVRVIGNGSTSANPGFIAIDKNTNGSGETKVVLIAERDSVKIGSLTEDTVNIVANNSKKMTILANGNVGIGTINPNAKLDVVGGDALINGITVGKGSGNGSTNTVVGLSALNSNPVGLSNTAVGAFALQLTTSGTNNVANGYQSLRFNTEGGFNTANGTDALQRNTTGNLNTGNGYAALFNNTSGNSNTANGSSAGRFLADGTTQNNLTDKSVYIGADTKAQAENQFNQIVIGYDAIGLGSNTAVLGSDEIKTTALKGNVGIGTTIPGNQFNVIGTGNIGGSDLADSYILAGTITKGIGIDPNEIVSKGGVLQIGTLDDKDMIIKANNAEVIRVDSNGNVGIGTGANPSQKLHVDGSARVTGAYHDSNDEPGTKLQVLTSTGTGTDWLDSSELTTKLVPIIVQAVSGQTSPTYTAENNMVELQWTGNIGVYTFTLPSATDVPYRVIRFAIDGSFPGGTGYRIDIKAQTGETIDGVATFGLTKTYEGCAVWSNGTEWIVIQAKA